VLLRRDLLDPHDRAVDSAVGAWSRSIDEAAWSQLYATTSRPFPAPDTGQMAIKVIDHYGDEVTQVYEIGTP
jgi:adenine-specific DNA-methyltransferase